MSETKPSAWALKAVDHNMDDAVDRMFKPTGEWTAELSRHDDLENPPDYVMLRDDYWQLYDSYNAALAAERDYGNRLTVQLDEAQKQLTAEREAVELYKVAFENANDTCSTLREQLAAERLKVERMTKAYMVCNQDWQDVTEQLDAATKEAIIVKVLTEELTKQLDAERLEIKRLKDMISQYAIDAYER